MLHFKFETKFYIWKLFICQLKLNCFQQESNFLKQGVMKEQHNV